MEVIVLENNLSHLRESLEAMEFKVIMLPAEPNEKIFEMLVADRIFLTKDPSPYGDKPAEFETLTISIQLIVERKPGYVVNRIVILLGRLDGWRKYRARTIELIDDDFRFSYRILPMTNVCVYRAKVYDLLWDLYESIASITDDPRFLIQRGEKIPKPISLVVKNSEHILSALNEVWERHSKFYLDFLSAETMILESEKIQALIDAKAKIEGYLKNECKVFKVLVEQNVERMEEYPTAEVPVGLIEKLEALDPMRLLNEFPLEVIKDEQK